MGGPLALDVATFESNRSPARRWATTSRLETVQQKTYRFCFIFFLRTYFFFFSAFSGLMFLISAADFLMIHGFDTSRAVSCEQLFCSSRCRPLIPPEDAVELLSGLIKSPLVRCYAVQCLQRCESNDAKLLLLIPLLVHDLRYEVCCFLAVC